MRIFRILAAVVFTAAGIALGALNPQPVVLDLGPASVAAGLGVMLLVALLAGAVCAGLALSLGVIVPLRQRLRARDRDAIRSPPETGA